MAAQTDNLKSRFKVYTVWDDDATAATARYIPTTWLPMGQRMLAQVAFGTGTGVDTFEIYAATDSAGTGATVVKSHAAPDDADASGDLLTLEVSAEDVKAALSGAQYVSVKLKNDNNADENAVSIFIEGGTAGGGRFQYDDLTADSVIA